MDTKRGLELLTGISGRLMAVMVLEDHESQLRLLLGDRRTGWQVALDDEADEASRARLLDEVRTVLRSMVDELVDVIKVTG